jgi:DNA-binding NtrC family response regulator
MATILIADDNVDLLHVQCEVLRYAGHEVVTATTGKEALRQARSRNFDLVITDIVMPDGDGIETIVEVRRRHPGTKIIAISGGGRISAGDYLPVAEKLGAAGTIAKPISAGQLLALVDRVLGEPGGGQIVDAAA